MSAAAYTPEPKILQLLGELCAEDISPEDAALLVSRLETDEQLREFYVAYLNLHAELMWSTVPREIPADAVPWTDELLMPVRPRQSLRISPVWLAVAATLLLAAYFVGLPAMIGLDRAWRMAAGVFNEDRQPHHIVPSDPVATIRDSVDVEWSDHVGKSLRDLQSASRRDASTSIAAGEPLAIDSGLVELQLKQGVALIIEGPADWSIDGNNNATLTRGKLVAKVPEQAIGFTLTTPTAKIVDLGTEFGVEVQPDGRFTLQVLKGEVETRARTANAKSVRLTAGQSVRFIGGNPNPEAIPFDGQLFVNIARRGSQSLRQNMPVLLFADNFSVLEPSDDINPGANDKPGRQSGLLAPLRYVEREGKAPATTQLGNSPAPHGLLFTGDAQARTLVSPAIDFIQQKEKPGRYTVEFLVNPGRRFDGAPDANGNWGGVHVGARDPIAEIPGPDGGIMFLVRGTGGYQLFEGAQLVREGSLRETLESADLSGWCKVRVEFDVPAFDGASRCLVRVFVNGRLLLEHRTAAGFINNFVGLDGLSSADIYHAFDDFKVLYEELPLSEGNSP